VILQIWITSRLGVLSKRPASAEGRLAFIEGIGARRAGGGQVRGEPAFPRAPRSALARRVARLRPRGRCAPFISQCRRWPEKPREPLRGGWSGRFARLIASQPFADGVARAAKLAGAIKFTSTCTRVVSAGKLMDCNALSRRKQWGGNVSLRRMISYADISLPAQIYLRLVETGTALALLVNNPLGRFSSGMTSTPVFGRTIGCPPLQHWFCMRRVLAF